MSSRDRLLAALVAVLWGINFPATELALEHFPPLFAVALRFALIAVPTVVLVPRPKVKLRWLLAVGTCLGILQFAFLYLAMDAGLQPGLASIVLQASAPFTVLIAGVALRERVTRRQAIGIGIAVVGLAAIAVYRAQVSAILPVALALCGALGWALGNVSSRKAAAPNPFHLTLWMSVVPPIPMALLALVVEGPHAVGHSLATVFTAGAVPADLGLLYVVVFATLVGYGLWNTLLARYPSSTVAPFSMLVPIVGVLASWLFFGEVPAVPELASGVLVIGGVLFASYRPRGGRTSRGGDASGGTGRGTGRGAGASTGRGAGVSTGRGAGADTGRDPGLGARRGTGAGTPGDARPVAPADEPHPSDYVV